MRFFVVWTGTTVIKMGARLNDAYYAQEFPRDTPLGDAIDVLRTHIVRLASGLDEPEPPKTDEPPQQERF